MNLYSIVQQFLARYIGALLNACRIQEGPGNQNYKIATLRWLLDCIYIPLMASLMLLTTPLMSA